jgi:hypothetical protein
MHRKTLLAAALAGGTLMGISSVAQAVPAVVASSPTVVVQSAPPAPIYERVPAPREGWVWAPGHHDWRDGRYVWISGRWVQDRPGWDWQEARWIQRPDGSWYLAGGQWVRSDRYAYDDDMRDRRWERGPNGDLDDDGVRNADDRDRDGDGVANRNDDFPNNPRRS